MDSAPIVESCSSSLLSLFNDNWKLRHERLQLDTSGDLREQCEVHPLGGELRDILDGRGGVLPYFGGGMVVWCAVAPDGRRLSEKVRELQSWVLGSFAWEDVGDGYRSADPMGDAFQEALAQSSPGGYFRWRCRSSDYSTIERLLATRWQLERARPERHRCRRPSLLELRARFELALTVGDHTSGTGIIESIDRNELDTALNTKLMRIRLWHAFREFEQIRTASWIGVLSTQVRLPLVIRQCLDDAACHTPIEEGRVEPTIETREHEEQVDAEQEDPWISWFAALSERDPEGARELLALVPPEGDGDKHPGALLAYAEHWDDVYLDENLLSAHPSLVREGLATFVRGVVRKRGFPDPNCAGLYLSVLRLWGKLHEGVGRGREEGHVLLELASALLQLNHAIDEVRAIVEGWWRARPVASQLPYALDAIELLAFEHPAADAAGDLWIASAETVRRDPGSLLTSEKILWREVGLRLGIDSATVHEYLPAEPDTDQVDAVRHMALGHIAIVCARERQARAAEATIQERTDAKVTLVTDTKAGEQTDTALGADVVLFVWMATTHAVFRAFDGLDRDKLCYVQGTGAASIVRSLERWSMTQSSEASGGSSGV